MKYRNMASAKTIDKEINQYLVRLNPHQKETVLTVVKTFAEDYFDPWTDKDFLTELDRPTDEYERGESKTLSLEELEKGARKSFKNRARKNEL